jgi:hypothetical protein
MPIRQKEQITMTSDPTLQVNSGEVAIIELNVEDVMLLESPGVTTPTLESEPTGVSVQPAAGRQQAQPISIVPTPQIPPIILPKRRVSGRYRSTGTGFQLELRVDVDGSQPLNRVSGDFYQTSGGTTTYFGSFIVNTPTATVTSNLVTIEGMGQYTWPTGASKIKVTIPRVTILQPPTAATITFFTTSGSQGATYVCPLVSPFFRTVQWEQDSVAGTVAFVTYNTGSLPQPPGSPARDLTVSKAYAEAGIEMQSAGTPNIVNTSAAGTDAKWDDAELNAAMVSNFSLWANIP